MDNNTNKTLAHQLINEVYISIYVLVSCFEFIKERDHRYFIYRMKARKELFIKELCRVYQIDVGDRVVKYKSSIDRSVENMHIGVNQPEISQVFDLLINRSNDLKEAYSELLFKKSTSEVEKMILRNHVKELTRDQSILRDYQENLETVEA